MNKKTLVISIDALISDDIPLLEALPNLGPIVKGAAQVRDIECIYPTLTYPCHVSIMTGCYPDKHGIVHNERLQVNVPKPQWNWWYKDIRVKTMLDYAKAGCSIYNSAHMTLEEVLEVMRQDVKAEKQVVRLHTGDPCLYGAIREQMDVLDEECIPYDYCPGVSSFCGAASALNLEYT